MFHKSFLFAIYHGNLRPKCDHIYGFVIYLRFMVRIHNILLFDLITFYTYSLVEVQAEQP